MRSAVLKAKTLPKSALMMMASRDLVAQQVLALASVAGQRVDM
jgi:hypothetical protein